MGRQLVGAVCEVETLPALVQPDVASDVRGQAGGAAAAAGFDNLGADETAGQRRGVSGVVA